VDWIGQFHLKSKNLALMGPVRQIGGMTNDSEIASKTAPVERGRFND
jgi:hypothetical protein